MRKVHLRYAKSIANCPPADGLIRRSLHSVHRCSDKDRSPQFCELDVSEVDLSYKYRHRSRVLFSTGPPNTSAVLFIYCGRSESAVKNRMTYTIGLPGLVNIITREAGVEDNERIEIDEPAALSLDPTRIEGCAARSWVQNGFNPRMHLFCLLFPKVCPQLLRAFSQEAGADGRRSENPDGSIKSVHEVRPFKVADQSPQSR